MRTITVKFRVKEGNYLTLKAIAKSWGHKGPGAIQKYIKQTITKLDTRKILS